MGCLHTILVLIVAAKSTSENQIVKLFNLDPARSENGFAARENLQTPSDKVGFTSRYILEQLGIDAEATEPTALSSLIQRFGSKFPSTREFSKYARSTLPFPHSQNDPDSCLMRWMEHEELLFRTLEKHIVSERLNLGFANDVDSFISFSLSVQNRRKSRVGFALENHFETLLKQHGITYERGALTEGRSRPDFLFPGRARYLDSGFTYQNLTMLAVKTTCKDRWRQILAEAARIPNKHLLTLEPAISLNQTNEMSEQLVQLVLPKQLHETFHRSQRTSLLSVAAFIDLLQDRQRGH